MHRIVYISKPTHPLSRAERDGLVAQARQRNAADGLTGALLCYGGYFLQVLEGARATVEATFERVCADPRHDQVVVIDRADDQPPQFERWSMIQVEVGPTADRAVQAFLRSLATAPDAAQARAAVALLAALAQRSCARPAGAEPGAAPAAGAEEPGPAPTRALTPRSPA